MISTAVVFAAGAGARFGGYKQFEDLGSERVIDRVVRTASQTCDHVVLVLPVGHRWEGAGVFATVPGGDTHAESVRNGVAAAPPDTDIIVLASASHPLGTEGLYRRVIDAVVGGADASVPIGYMADAVKRRDGYRIISTVDKTNLATAQAPSAFAYQALVETLAEQRNVPEELQLIEESGGNVVFVDGEETNLHLTTPLELRMANLLLPLLDG